MKNLFIALFTFLSIASIGQNTPLSLQRVLRVNVLNPGIEYEFPVSKKAVIAINPGIGWNSSYISSRSPFGGSGLTHFISPFLDIESLLTDKSRDFKFYSLYRPVYGRLVYFFKSDPSLNQV